MWPGWPRPHKRPFRFIEDRREHLTAGAIRANITEMTAYADKRGKLLALDARSR